VDHRKQVPVCVGGKHDHAHALISEQPSQSRHSRRIAGRQRFDILVPAIDVLNPAEQFPPIFHQPLLRADPLADHRQQHDQDHQRPLVEPEAAAGRGLVGHAAILSHGG
jgi:hypothetical protein